MERATTIQGRAPNVTELTGCEDDGEMNAEDREALKRHDLLIDENRDRITALMSEYRSDQKWLREAMTEQGKKIDRVAERVDSIDRTVNNGIKERQLDISQRLAKVETALDGVVTQDEMAVHREESEKLNREKWDGHERRAAEKRKNTGLIIAVVGNLLTLASVVALYLSLGGG
jgi:cysteinyl-tRNA synthetase